MTCFEAEVKDFEKQLEYTKRLYDGIEVQFSLRIIESKDEQVR